MFVSHFYYFKPLHEQLEFDHDMGPSEKLREWVKKNNQCDKLEAFYLWGHASYSASRFWNGINRRIEDIVNAISSPRITSRQLEKIVNLCENVSSVAEVFLQTLGKELPKVSSSLQPTRKECDRWRAMFPS